MTKEERWEYNKQYRINNADKIKQHNNQYDKDHTIERRQRDKNHAAERSQYNKKYCKDHAAEKKRYYKDHAYERNQRDKQRRKTDIQFKLSRSLRTRLWMALKNNQKGGVCRAGLRLFNVGIDNIFRVTIPTRNDLEELE